MQHQIYVIYSYGLQHLRKPEAFIA